MLLKTGSRGKQVETLQELLKIDVDGIFGNKTHAAVIAFQKENSLATDGIVGPKTWKALTKDRDHYPSSDNSELIDNNSIYNGERLREYFLNQGEYFLGPVEKKYLFLHHTAGWENAMKQIDIWNRDSLDKVGTEFVISGQRVNECNEGSVDGDIYQAIPEGGYAWHLGRNGNHEMHVHSVGIEVCNFGWIDNKNRTYTGTVADASQIVTLESSFRGYKRWHRYSNRQIESLRQLILFIANRDNIDVRKGLVSEVKKRGAAGFEFNKDAWNGSIKGMWSHSNVRKDKFDMFPQQELLDMLVSL